MRVVRAFLAVTAAAAVCAGSAAAALQIKGVDASGYPTIRATVVTDGAGGAAPSLLENGRIAAGVSAENLGRAKSVVVAIDRSESMRGQALVDAVEGARAFVAAKPAGDRVSIVAFGHRAESLTPFSTATIDADSALRTLTVDGNRGTALYDAVALAASSTASEALPARVLILLTDGNDASSTATLDEAIDRAHESGMAVYAIGIEGRGFDPSALRRMAAATGGSYYGAASTAALTDVYTSISEELRHTWQVEYVTAARPGDRVELTATSGTERSTSAATTIPGSTPATDKPKPSPLLPAPALTSRFGPLVLGLAVALLLLVAAGLGFSGPKGSRLRRRLAPHVGAARKIEVVGGGERLAVAAGLFRATERTLGHLKPWRFVASLLERADLPIRTVEFFYLMGGCSLLFGLVAAVVGPPTLVVLAALLAGALVPLAFVWYKARRRLRAFENQLPDLLITMAASLKAGHSFRQGMQAVIEEDQEPASKEFKRVLAETRLGRPMDEALSEMAQRIGSKNFEFVITAVTIQRQIGGSLAGIFDMVADTVRDRQQFARKIRGLTAMGRMSAYVLIGLPFFVLGIITLVNAKYMSPLWHTSTGHNLLFGMLGMMAFGSLILKKIVSFRG